ncbi:MAG: DNA methylase [Lachnospiraceae bacterium]|nr:DNA methylase [Lachnospiraceae bacterium]
MFENRQKSYVCIDLKSFYASVECVERGLDPLTANLVVADTTRTEKTICLAVSPSLKAYGISGRARLFEVVQRVREINAERTAKAPGRKLTGESADDTEVRRDPSLRLSYVAAPPQMAHYINVSTAIYRIYLRYVAPEDILVYSIDEVFMDVTAYLETYKMKPVELAMRMIHDVLSETGITATAGVGTNMYLAKVAMDIVAKHMEPDENGVRIAEIDEMAYRRLLWGHRPLTDFWRVGPGYASRLESHGMYTMGDVARCSVGQPDDYHNEELLYRLFGVNAELLIDHAWGWEPCTIDAAKNYTPENNSLSQGQVLMEPYTMEKARLIVREMAEEMVLDMVSKSLVTDRVGLMIGYDISNLSDPEIRKRYKGPVNRDWYGRPHPKHTGGSRKLDRYTSSGMLITDALLKIFDETTYPELLIRRVNVSAEHVIPEDKIPEEQNYVQMDLFTDYVALKEKEDREREMLKKERRIQEAVISVKQKYGKNAILRGSDLEEGATAMQRHNQIGGHKA